MKNPLILLSTISNTLSAIAESLSGISNSLYHLKLLYELKLVDADTQGQLLITFFTTSNGAPASEPGESREARTLGRKIQVPLGHSKQHVFRQCYGWPCHSILIELIDEAPAMSIVDVRIGNISVSFEGSTGSLEITDPKLVQHFDMGTQLLVTVKNHLDPIS
jgi:hypothetical protein